MKQNNEVLDWHGTTIVLVRKGNEVVVAGDGQVSIGNTVMKSTAKKVRKIEKRNVIAGFAGSTADAFTLFERLEAKLEKHGGQLMRAAVELAKSKDGLSWLEVSFDDMKGKFVTYPDRSELSSEINENLIIELYSK